MQLTMIPIAEVHRSRIEQTAIVFFLDLQLINS